jgi:anion-transporting  ArsA/GET3 family ATPase
LEFAPREIERRLYAMAMDPEESLKEYLRINLRIPFVTKVGALSAAFDFLANAAPGVREIVTIGKVAYEVRERHYDLVVVDATSTGHIVSQLGAPQAINELVGTGMIRSQTKWILDILGDPDQTGVVLVTTPEEMPVNESIELAEKLRTQTNVDLAAVVANRVLPETFSGGPAAFERLLKGRGRFETRLQDPSTANALLDGACLANDLRRAGDLHLDRLFTSIEESDDRAESAIVPLLFDAEPGIETTRLVAGYLESELNL